jgi:sugar transferase (PEP-CTERM system associated)
VGSSGAAKIPGENNTQPSKPDRRLNPVSTESDFIPPVSAPRTSGWRISRSSVRLFGQNLDFRILLLASVDFLILVASLHLATLGRYLGDFGARDAALGSVMIESLVFAACTMTCLIAMGLYNRRLDQRTIAVLARVLVGFAAGAVAMMVLLFATDSMRLGRASLGLSIVIALPLLGVSRVLYVRALGRDRFARRVLVYGAGKRASELGAVRVRQDLRGFQVIGYVPTDNDARAIAPELCLRAPDDLRDFVQHHDVDEVVVAMDDRRRGLPVEQLLNCRLAGVPVTDVLTFVERESGKVELSMLYPSWLIFSEDINPRGLTRIATRLFDLATAMVLLVLALPLMLLTALAIWVESGFKGQVMYSQSRVGLEGLPFTLYKFRSMQQDAEKNGAVWAQSDDPRVTRVGSFIRKTRLDELPQLLNVLKGEMSFVGPRPERPEFVDQLSKKIPYYRERHCVKPGITGWAQLCYPYGASEQDALEKLQYDLYYVKNKTILFDMIILLQTAEVILWRKGAR